MPTLEEIKKRKQYITYANQTEEKYGLPKNLLVGVMGAESNFNPNAVSHVGAKGLMQFMKATAQEYGINPLNPSESINAAGKYLQSSYKKFGNWEDALRSYNMGVGGLQKVKAGKKSLPKETKDYVGRVYKYAGIKYEDPSYVNTSPQDNNQVQETITPTLNYFDIPKETPTFASVPDSAEEKKETVEDGVTSKDVAEVETKTKEYNFLEELQKEDYSHLQPEQVAQQQTVPQVDFMQQYEQVSQFIDQPLAQQGGLKGQVRYGTPEYREAYNKGEVITKKGERSPILLDEVVVKGKNKDKNWLEQYADKITEENKDSGILGAIIGTPISAVTSFPQMFATKAMSGEMQRPSEAIDIQNPYGAMAVDVVADPANLIGLGVLTKEKALAKLATSKESGLLSNTYKLNPLAEKLKNPNNSYRVAGIDSYEDFVKSGVLRSKTNLPENPTVLDRMNARPTAFPSFQKGFADINYLPENGGVIYETNLPTFRRGDINPVTNLPIKGRHYAHRVIDPNSGNAVSEIPSSSVKVFEGKPDWLKGFKEMQQGGSWQEKLANRPKKPTVAEIIAEGDARKAQQRAQTDNIPNTKRDLSLMLAEHNNIKKDEQELRTTGQIKNPNSIQYRRNVKTQPDIKQDDISTEQRNAQLNPLQRPLIYLANPEKVLGDLGVPNMETSELDRQAINRNRFNPYQSGTDRFLNNAKIGLGYVPEATVNTAMAAAFMPEGSGALGLVNEALNPLAGIKHSLPDELRQGLRTQGFGSQINKENFNKLLDAKVIPTFQRNLPQKVNLKETEDAIELMGGNRRLASIHIGKNSQNQAFPLMIKVDPKLWGNKTQDLLYDAAVKKSQKEGYIGLTSGNHLLSPEKTAKAHERFDYILQDYKGIGGVDVKTLTGHKNPNIEQEWFENYKNIPKNFEKTSLSEIGKYTARNAKDIALGTTALATTAGIGDIMGINMINPDYESKIIKWAREQNNKDNEHLFEEQNKQQGGYIPIAGASYLATQGQNKQQGGKQNYTENELAFLSEIQGIPVSSRGMYDYPNQEVIVPTNGSITMKGIPHKIKAKSLETGEEKILKPNREYYFKNTKNVLEIPFFKK